MQTVTFAKPWRHYTVEETTMFPAGHSGKVTNEIADEARAAGVLEENTSGPRDRAAPRDPDPAQE